MYIPQNGIFGDYQLLFDLKSNIVFKTASNVTSVRFMCLHKKVLNKLCDLFPETYEKLKVVAF